MPRTGPQHRLSPIFVRTCKTPGVYMDGGGLRLRVMDNGSRIWIMRITAKGRRRDIGLGPLSTLSLADARQKAGSIRQQVADGGDLLADRRAAHRKRQAAEIAAKDNSNSSTFHACWRAFWALKEPQLSNGKHRDQWVATMGTYVLPFIGKRPIAEITPGEIIKLLAPIWLIKAETARRVLQRMDAVFVSAITRELRQKASPCTGVARELGNRRQEARHHAALPYTQVPAFVKRLRLRRGPLASSLAFEFLILTVTRSGETRGALWAEMDMEKRMWTISAARMKGRTEHIVPLSDRAIAILNAARAAHPGSEHCFPNAKDATFSDMVFTKALRDMGLGGEVTAHGFRTSFKTWAAETGVRDEVSEAALAHVDTNKVRAAYRRTTYLEERHVVMQDWSAFASPT